MTVGQRIFELLKQKGMTQKEFSERTGIATTTISDWRKKNTNPGSDKILLICAALEVTPEYLLSGVSEDSDRGRHKEYVVIPKNTEERLLIEVFGKMDFEERKNYIENIYISRYYLTIINEKWRCILWRLLLLDHHQICEIITAKYLSNAVKNVHL